jgi:serine/threonine-protein kinase
MDFLDKIKGVFSTGKSNKAKRLDVSRRFEMHRHAFHGTMSKFHVVRDINTGERFGIKLLDDEKTRQFRDRFKGLIMPSEGEIGTLIKHPQVAKTIEFGMTIQNVEYILMEWIDGPGMNILVKNRSEDFRPQRLELVRKMVAALQAVHEAGFIHRDICPRNYICNRSLTDVKLIDFGLTVPDKEEFRRPGNRTGTPQYMAPEVIRRRETDTRLDIFSLGVTIYRMLAFDHPWGTTDTTGIAALAHDQRPADSILKHRPDLNPALAELVHRCLEIDKEKRIPSCKFLLQKLQSIETETV